MSIMKNIFFTVLVFILFYSCTDAPDFPDEPQIEFISISKSELQQDDLNTDSLSIFLSFTDGDGDIGSEQNSSEQNIFLIDTRTGFTQDKFKIPFVPPQGTGNGISGTMEILAFTTCCIYPDRTPPCTPSTKFPKDTLQYEIYIVDRAGNESNHVFTGDIILNCN